MTLRTIRITFFATVAAIFLLGSLGCSNRPAAAQKLFDQGEYQQVVDKYPELEIARRAHAKLGELALQQKNYNAVLKDFWDTPAAYQAKMLLAQAMFDQGRYRALLDSFPQSPLAVQAKEKLADSLYALGQLDVVVQMYPESQKAKLIKDERSKESLTKAKKLRGEPKRLALEELVRSYGGTDAAREAGEILSKIRETEAKKKK
jgi:outer membrane protein assembly factor BamD (BamD/ComL family)